MTDGFRKLVAWTLLSQVLLVGGLGTGLHGLFGCEHGPGGSCSSTCCTDSDTSKCADCVFCRRTAEKDASRSADASSTLTAVPSVDGACDGCAVCDLLAKYHTATPLELSDLTIELTAGEAALQRQNAVIAASVRLALSRGPPAV